MARARRANRHRLYRRRHRHPPVYISGLTDHRLKDADIVDHLVELVEKKAAQIETEKQRETEAGLAAAG